MGNKKGKRRKTVKKGRERDLVRDSALLNWKEEEKHMKSTGAKLEWKYTCISYPWIGKAFSFGLLKTDRQCHYLQIVRKDTQSRKKIENLYLTL